MTGLAFLALGFLTGWASAELRTAWRDLDRYRDTFDVHADEAVDVARPMGPEDDPTFWGKR